jgi:cysteine-rich repeat protein
VPLRRFFPASSRSALFGAALALSCLDWSSLEIGSCGDGFVGREEACDDGNRISGDGCSDSCRVEPPYCGDGRMDLDEYCDDANLLDTDACIAGCQNASCGDGKLWEAQEACDDGNRVDGDGCSSECLVEPLPSGPRCGDQALDAGEVCDDGNESNADACATNCGWTTCGDGRVRNGVEECDDGNAVRGDGCAGCLLCGDEPNSFFRVGNGHCYTLHDAAASQSEARSACQAQGGDLWTVTSQGEGRDVSMNLMLAERYWLGLQTNVNGRSWVSGEATTYTNFAPGEPSAPAGRCVALQQEDAGNTWFSQPCSDVLPFVCERASALIFPIDHHAFQLHGEALDASQARATCEATGGYLAILESQDERLFVAKNVGLAVWLDASDAAAEGQFVWASGTAVDSSGFAMGQPDDSDQTQNCLFLNQSGRFADGPCTEKHAFLCEIE